MDGSPKRGTGPRPRPGPTGIGVALPRSEDFRLLTGRGNYAADLVCADACFAAFVRSPHAHAAIVAIDAAAALAMPGVRAVLTGADAAADRLGAIPHNTDFSSPPDARLRLPEGFAAFTSRPSLADWRHLCGQQSSSDRLRHRFGARLFACWNAVERAAKFQFRTAFPLPARIQQSDLDRLGAFCRIFCSGFVARESTSVTGLWHSLRLRR